MLLRPGLVELDSNAYKEVLEDIAKKNVKSYTISSPRGGGKDEFFAVVRENLPLDPPLVSNRSWDALTDSLRGGLGELNEEQVVILWHAAGNLRLANSDTYRIAWATFEEIAGTLIEPKFNNGVKKTLTVFVDRSDNVLG